jgi:hypothetical protein
MEVHAHSHTPRKKWTHYFWEFLMLFLAVFCGFLAENQREHMIEHKREKQYIVSMIEDLKADTTKLGFIVHDNQSLNAPLDSLLHHFDEINKGFNNSFSRNLYALNGFEDFHPTDRTIQQLKSAGNMRLIRNMAASDSVMEYDAAVQDVLIETASLGIRYEHISNSIIEIFDYQKMNKLFRTKGRSEFKASKENFLLTNESSILGKFYNEIDRYGGTLQNVTLLLNNLKT